MKPILWNDDKNKSLKQERGIGFEDVIYYIEKEIVIDIIKHPDPNKCKNQRIYVININDYIYLVLFVESDELIFLKTIIPSRRFTKLYLGGTKDE
ncbi:MAG: BrnT family toxin [Candidatus Hydrogenedentota bacterium]